MAGYLSGHVPWGVGDEIIWRVPEPRFYLDLAHARFPHTVWKRTRRRGWTGRINGDFEQVMRGCAEAPRANDTEWITPAVAEQYRALHRAGLAVSFEVWHGEDLIAGEIGVLAGGVYFCETKFHRADEAGNFLSGMAVLTLADAGFSVYDTQYGPAYLGRFSSKGLEPLDADAFPMVMARAAAKRFERIGAGAPAVLTKPVLPE
ncbi:leucyl/phenylalanyl-tRNA--protein transferase [Streptomyces sp. XD-27]|uniref:leucyl/phenylalanyl-tRNA--protein transferase n=1 Tax=Streptomyces sp. XD-27 TaxID=3062779 RepID=UPI0026F41497|nr:leucyl/phenylalanyl-tRNA--protein transferase [Streptomyces sp. XD-27]WKX74563.1 leucyl/phenylalanyl-tRNA--protein transferase [Streptomyces sp. XD-27]